jgi:hypothetical protein
VALEDLSKKCDVATTDAELSGFLATDVTELGKAIDSATGE